MEHTAVQCDCASACFLQIIISVMLPLSCYHCYSYRKEVVDIGADSTGSTGNVATVLMKEPCKHYLLPR